jgi:Uma2 family endonuclease
LTARLRPTSGGLRLVDRTLKAAAYARHGVASYWLVDPDAQCPVLTVQELRGGAYVEVARATGDQRLVLTRPFPVTLVPADLVVGLRPD